MKIDWEQVSLSIESKHHLELKGKGCMRHVKGKSRFCILLVGVQHSFPDAETWLQGSSKAQKSAAEEMTKG
jgi:fumarylacetoacetate (FAA) hydrolase family protein